MMTTETMTAMEFTDADLVAESRSGSRDAFRQIVERYQTLICSLAYSATGNVSQSEDLAQETFLAAWKDLRSLRDPNKLRAWLCGIVRHQIHKSLHREGREPAHDAMPLEEVHDSPALDALPSEQAVSREEEAILWRSLQRIPEIYREPFILFYREHQSIESVASELELSEDAVKQRLSRGRKLLQEEVQAFVENTLRRTAPGEAFAGAVLAAMPLAAGSAATSMIAAAKGTAAAKSSFLAAWLLPVITLLSGVAAGWLLVRSAPTPRERRVKKIALFSIWGFALAWCGLGELALQALSKYWKWNDLTYFFAMSVFWWLYATIVATFIMIMFRQILASRRQSALEAGVSQASGTPLTLGARVLVVAGIYLCSFSWPFTLAWRAQDWLSIGILAGAIVLLAVCHFLQSRAPAKVGAIQRGITCLTLAWGVVLVMLNLRLDRWLAARSDVSIAEIHYLYPMWYVPLLSLAFLLYIGLVLFHHQPKALRQWKNRDLKIERPVVLPFGSSGAGRFPLAFTNSGSSINGPCPRPNKRTRWSSSNPIHSGVTSMARSRPG